MTCGLVIACAVPTRRRAGGAVGPRFRDGDGDGDATTRFDVGAGVESITPPLAGKPAHDPALCTSNPAYNGPHVFSLEEPYIDAAHTGTYEPGDPYVDCNGNGRWDGIILGGGANSPRFASMVADPITARAIAVSNGKRTIIVEVLDNEGVFDVYQAGSAPRSQPTATAPTASSSRHARRVGSRTRSASPASTS